MKTGEQHRYTLDEARQLLAERECRHSGHELEQITDAAGEIRRVVCTRCPATYVRERRRQG